VEQAVKSAVVKIDNKKPNCR